MQPKATWPAVSGLTNTSTPVSSKRLMHSITCPNSEQERLGLVTSENLLCRHVSSSMVEEDMLIHFSMNLPPFRNVGVLFGKRPKLLLFHLL